MKHTWILATVVALALSSWTLAKSGDSEKEVRFASVPREVQETINNERKSHEIKSVWLVTRDGREFYRAIIDTKGADLMIRVAPGGKLLGTDEVRDRSHGPAASDFDREVKIVEVPEVVRVSINTERKVHEIKSVWHVSRDGKEFYRAVIDTKGDDLVIRVGLNGKILGRDEMNDVAMVVVGVKKEVVLANDETDGVLVIYERLPGPVRAEIGRLAKGHKVIEVVRYKHNGRVMYRAEVGEGKYIQYIRVSEGGLGRGVRGVIDPGVLIPFDRCPGAVKSKIGSLVRANKIEEVIKYDRGGKTYYQAQVEDNFGKDYFVTVDAGGKQVDALPRP